MWTRPRLSKLTPALPQPGNNHVTRWARVLVTLIILSLFPLIVPATQAASTIDELPTLASFTTARFDYLTTLGRGSSRVVNYGGGVQVLPARVSIWSGANTRDTLANYTRLGETLNRNDGSGWRRVDDFPLDPTYVASLVGRIDELEKAATGVVEIGKESIGSVSTTHYQLWLRDNALENFIGDTSRFTDAERDRLTDATYKVDLWVGQADQRLYQHLVTLTIPTAPVAEMTSLITYTSFDDPAIAVEGVPTQAPRFETSVCAFEAPEELTIDCGYLTVVEDRDRPTGPTIRLAVAIVRSPNPNKALDPFVYLEGGPGGASVANAASLAEGFAPILTNRDLILFDQRGTGLSEPSLSCTKDELPVTYDLLDENISRAQANQETIAAHIRCVERLRNEGANLSAYNSAESARDLNDLRVALGYPEWNILGISYGTRLALTAMRDTPAGIRSVILDSTSPPEVNDTANTPAYADRAFRTLFTQCAGDPACNAAYPDLENVFYGVVDQLNASPITIPVTNTLTQEPVDALFNGDNLVSTMFQLFYIREVIPALPRLIYDAQAGNYELLRQIYPRLLEAFAGAVSTGMYYAVECSENIPFVTPADIIAVGNQYPRIRAAFGADETGANTVFTICEAYDLPAPNPIENAPVRSSIPTLVLAGEYDPITPPADGQLAARSLPNSFFYEFPSTTHGVIPAGECQGSIAATFFDNPTAAPNTSCIATIDELSFVVPE